MRWFRGMAMVLVGIMLLTISGSAFAAVKDDTVSPLYLYTRKVKASLCELVIDGIPTNIEEQLRIVEDDRFTSGNYDLTFMSNR